MNRVQKSEEIPETLLTCSERETKKVRKEVLEENKITFRHDIYAAPDVKNLLKADQNGKCAYCERFFNGDYGAVEHFRPKGAYQKDGEQKLYSPAYYWLAYDWDNLLYSCSECNTSFKRNSFPLVDETARDILHEDISRETPLLLNPAVDEVGDYIEFHRYMIVPKEIGQGQAKAEKTIEVLQLNDRPVLVDRRKSVWNKYENLCKSLEIAKIKGPQEFVDCVSRLISDMKSEQAEFTGMFKYQSLGVSASR